MLQPPGTAAARASWRRLSVSRAISGAWLSKSTLSLLLAFSLGGCAGGVLDPKGPIGSAQKSILLNSLGIMLAIVIPTIIATLATAWWFRESNTRAVYRPDFTYSGRIELIVWSIPMIIILLLGGIAWVGAHDLDPAKPIASPVAPVRVEVVSLDWKWLFIYPDQGVASVNRLVVPAGTPISFSLTSSGVMNSFFVPQLGTQIYTMAGMVTRLNLQADEPGTYRGMSSQFSGDGFADMHFEVVALPEGEFGAWAAATRAKGGVLTPASYAALRRPSKDVPPSSYGSVSPNLFDAVVEGRDEALAGARNCSPDKG
ncbi:ubiquinol oxidase subunit II [Sphingopyxis sp. LARHCG72]